MVPSRLLSQYCLPERCPTSTRSTSAIRCASASICKAVRLARAGHDGLADGQVLRMDTSVITALAALAGAAIGGLTSVMASWLTQRSQAREQRLAHYQLRRQNIYKEFIELASKLYIHALQNDKADVSALMGLYAEIAKMRALSSASVVDSADQIVKKIINAYLEPNKTLPELRQMANSGLIDPHRNFSEACRAESERLHFGPPA